MSKSEKEPNLFVKKTVRDFVNANGCNVAGKVINGNTLNNAIKKLLTLAMDRAKKQKRKTVMVQDLK